MTTAHVVSYINMTHAPASYPQPVPFEDSAVLYYVTPCSSCLALCALNTQCP